MNLKCSAHIVTKVERNISLPFLWIATGIFILTTSLVLIGDIVVTWSNYLLLGISILLMISSAIVLFFTYSYLEHANWLKSHGLYRQNNNTCRRVLEATLAVFTMFVVACTIILIFNMLVLFHSVSIDRLITNGLLKYLWLSWLIQAPYIAIFFCRYLKNRRRYVNNLLEFESPITNSESQHGRAALFLITQITSRDGPLIVQNVIDKSRSITNQIIQRHGYRIGHRIDLVIEENAEKKYDFHDANIVAVPSDYETPRGSRYKCRALHYTTELRRKRRENTKDYWIFHLDEESFVTTQCMESVLKYISDPNSPPVAEGPIIYPNRLLEVDPICRVVECMRPYICYDCVSQFDGHSLPIYMHGSNLLVRAHIEDNIGWDYRNPASEDQRFGHNVWLKYGPKAFGWHGGMIEEQPPLSIKSLIKQRRRWFVGDIYNMRTGDIPLIRKIEITGRWISWSTGFISGLVSIAALVLPQSIPEPVSIFLSTITALWFFGYQQGLRENLRPLKLSRSKQIYYHIQTALLTPIAGLIDTYGAFSAPFYVYNFEWEPTEKVIKTERTDETQLLELEDHISAS